MNRSTFYPSKSTLGKRARHQNTDYKIACLVPLGIELAPLRAMLDEIHDDVPANRDHNAYVLGALGRNYIVIATLPSTGNNDSGVVANQLLNDFPSVRFGLLIGIGGGIPDLKRSNDIRFGDVVVSEPNGNTGGVVQFDRGKRHGTDKFQVTGHLNKPPALLVSTMKKLKAQHFQEGNQLEMLIDDMIQRNPNMKETFSFPGAQKDLLYETGYEHVGGDTCSDCDMTRTVQRKKRLHDQIKVHYGTIGSSNAVIRNATERDRLGKEYNMLSVEMEAAGVMDTLPCLVIRGICDYADSHKNKIWQPYAAAAAAAYAKELLQSICSDREMHPSPFEASEFTSSPVALSRSTTLNFTESKDTTIATSNTTEPLFRKLLDSLTFEGMNVRFRNISEALPDTCKWLFNHQDFKNWTARSYAHEHHGFLWIKGKPGSGKSTMMKRIFRWATTAWSDEIAFAFFFNARSNNELEKSSAGFYRSLAHHLLLKYPHIRALFLDEFQCKGKDICVDDWTVSELMAFLGSSIRGLQRQPLNIFIDALDEGEEDDVRQMVAFLEEVSSSACSSMFPLRICLSSRHFPYITVRHGLSLVMDSQHGLQSDIKLYIRTKLVDDGSAGIKKLRDKVHEKAAGIFLWVVLVVSILNKSYDKGNSIQHMIRLIDRIPQELDDLFAKILTHRRDDIDGSDDCLSLFQWVLFSRRALSPAELYMAIHSSSIPPRYEDEEEGLTTARLERYLLHTSRGLVFLTKSQPPVVQFIHETVREFLGRKGLTQIDASLSKDVSGLSNDKLKMGCFQCLQICSQRSDASEATPFLDYAAEHLYEHAELAEASGISQLGFLTQLCNDDSAVLKSLRPAFDAIDRGYYYSTHLLHLFVERDHRSLLAALIRQGVNINEQHGPFGTALQTACILRFEPIARLLIEAGAGVNIQGGRYGNALQAACTSCSKALVSLLIEKGANVNAQGGRYGNALTAARARSRHENVRLLTEHGANELHTSADNSAVISTDGKSRVLYNFATLIRNLM